MRSIATLLLGCAVWFAATPQSVDAQDKVTPAEKPAAQKTENPAAPAPPAAQGKPAGQMTILEIQGVLAGMDHLRSHGQMSEADYQAAEAYFIAEAERISGMSDLTRKDIDNWRFRTGGELAMNIFLVLVSLLAVAFVIGVFGLYFWPILIQIPSQIWMMGLYALCAFGMFGSPFVWDSMPSLLQTFDPIWAVFPMALLFLGALCLTKKLYFDRGDDDAAATTIALVAGLVWAALTLVLFFNGIWGASIIGFLSVMAVLAAAGFSVWAGYMCVALGFKDEDAVARGTFISAFMVIGGVVGSVSGLGFLTPFVAGMLFCGCMVYYIGLLILCFKTQSWFGSEQKDGPWLILQILMIVSGLAALLGGSFLGVGQWMWIGGLWFVIYLMFRVEEVIFKSVGVVWGLGVSAAFGYFVYWLVNSNFDAIIRFLTV